MKVSAPKVKRQAGRSKNKKRDGNDSRRERRSRFLHSSLAERAGCRRINHSVSQFGLRSLVEMCSTAASDLVELSRCGFGFVRRFDLNRDVPDVEP